MKYSTELIRENVERAQNAIQDALANSGLSQEVRIMAVTKTHSVELVQKTIEAGITLIGENRVSEGGRKVREIGKEKAEFHMIGPLHTKEVRQVIRDFHAVDSLCRMKIAKEIARRVESNEIQQPSILIEVNTSGEESKHGLPPEIGLIEDMITEMIKLGLKIDGFLTIGPLAGTDLQIRKAFASLRGIRDSLETATGLVFPELSMGMSDDFHLAVMEGATTVRLGRYLFGRRRN